MSKFSLLVRRALLWTLVIGAQACNQEAPTPKESLTESSRTTGTLLRKLPDGKNDSIKVVRAKIVIKNQHPTAATPQSQAKGGTFTPHGKNLNTSGTTSTLLIVYCTEVWDIYYNTYTGEVISREFVSRTCPGDSGGSTGGGDTSGGGGSSGDGGVTPNGYYGTESTSDTEDTILPADCASWPFTAVGPSGYMACGVSDIKVDVLSQYVDASGVYHLEYTFFIFNTLYFEMPPSFTPGQAAAIAARNKDLAEDFVEGKFGSSGARASATQIESAFYNKLSGLMANYGGRLSRQPNYPNIQTGEYSFTFLPGNGGCN